MKALARIAHSPGSSVKMVPHLAADPARLAGTSSELAESAWGSRPAFDLSRVSIFPPGASAAPGGEIQTKLAISRSEDPFEREADQVADKVMRMEEPAALGTTGASTVPVSFASEPAIARQPQGDAAPVAQTAQAERELEVEAVKDGATSYVIYEKTVRGGGSSSWLANNPGNLDYTADTVAWSCYEGKKLEWGAHRFAIFADEELGLAAVRSFLRKYQTIRNITLMMNLFAPAGDLQNDPTKYSKKVAQKIGPPVTVNTLVKDLSDDQIKVFALAIKEQEGWTPGPVNDVPRGDASLPEKIRSR